MHRYFFSTTIIFTILSLTLNVFAATYFVKNNGDDNNSGLSDIKAWKTISKVNNKFFKTGDKVYFKCDDKWIMNKCLYIDWGGDANNRAVVGAYYMNKGTEIIGVKGKKPIFDGNDSYPKGDPLKEARWGSLVVCNKNNYVTVENIRAVNSEGHAFNFVNGTSLRALNLETQNTISNGIQFYNINTGLIENCIIKDYARVFLEYPGNDWPAGIALVRGGGSITVRHSIVCEGYGEGIGVYFKSDNNTIENNTLYANRAVQIYLAQTRGNIVRRNIVYGTTDVNYHRRRGNGLRFPGHGISVCDEPQYHLAYTENNKIYDNFIAYCGGGISLSTGNNEGAYIQDTEVYNNTFVDCWPNINILRGPFDNSFIRNNIFWSITTTGDYASTCYKGLFSTPGLTWSNNLWTTEPDGDASGTGDVIGIPKLNKTTGWRLLKGGDLKFSDFALAPNSPAINAGVKLNDKFRMTLDCALSDWSTETFVLKDQNNHGDKWEIGGSIYAPDLGMLPSIEPPVLRISRK